MSGNDHISRMGLLTSRASTERLLSGAITRYIVEHYDQTALTLNLADLRADVSITRLVSDLEHEHEHENTRAGRALDAQTHARAAAAAASIFRQICRAVKDRFRSRLTKAASISKVVLDARDVVDGENVEWLADALPDLKAIELKDVPKPFVPSVLEMREFVKLFKTLREVNGSDVVGLRSTRNVNMTGT